MLRNQAYSIVFAVLFVLSVSAAVLGIANVFSIVPAVVFAAFFVYNSLPQNVIDSLHRYKWFDTLYNLITNLTSFGAVLCCVSLIIMLFYAFGATAQNPDTVIVLGCQTRNGEASRMLAGRLETAYTYLEQNENAIAIVSGGQGEDEICPESEVMKKYLVDKGIDPDRIIEEDKSVNTSTNIIYSAEIIKQRNLSQDVLIVTDWYHQLRATKMAQKSGLNPTAKSTFTNILLVEPMFYREICAIVKFIITGG